MTVLQIQTSARADADIAAALDHYLSQEAPEAAQAFIDALEETFELLKRHPHIGSTRLGAESRLPNLLSYTLKRFPYIVCYIVTEQAVVVIRVLHAQRDIPALLKDL